ncbi:MAG: FAD binding domain-containing protein, partial [Planctomycetota bacterium]
MKQFAYLDAQNFDAAAKAAVAESVHVKGAGTDLVDLLKSYIVEPDAVVNLLPIREKEQEGQISALSTLEDVATDEWVKLEFPALHTAAHEAATPQVRHVGTVGGNLAQNTRCWYYRTPGHECRKKGDEGCAAESPLAQNKYHGIFASGGCAAAHTSNLAPALIALKAQVECVHPDGNRTMDAELLYDGEAETNHGIIDYLVVTSVDWLDSLDAGVRDQFLTILAEVTETRNAESTKVNEEA